MTRRGCWSWEKGQGSRRIWTRGCWGPDCCRPFSWRTCSRLRRIHWCWRSCCCGAAWPGWNRFGIALCFIRRRLFRKESGIWPSFLRLHPTILTFCQWAWSCSTAWPEESWSCSYCSASATLNSPSSATFHSLCTSWAPCWWPANHTAASWWSTEAWR